ncbi:MAG TPA: bifunctional phosphoribosylaminoimidazolecarboxamide formyltransferase/IMP cyclohydrolase [Nitrolancea sp.]|nr:bifunctional phosphoribosylaminoimidazolecarboxamide formyltransferase/IMP cyclohydrolase [Nitrolancea sp.]
MPRALLSVSDKSGLAVFARRLARLGFELISTGGTLQALTDAGVPAISVVDVTGFPEIMAGRVKTLHPAIHAPLLARRDVPEDLAIMEEMGFTGIDLLAGNLYPFAQTVARPGVTLADALENIDIGGPAMIRAAAKNFPAVLVVVDPADYDPLADAIERESLTGIDLERRQALAAKAFAHVSAYDAVIAAYLRPEDQFPERITVAGEKLADLRYGENPHQPGALYRRLAPGPVAGVGVWRLLAGPEMSFNNYLDANAALTAALGFPEPTCAIIKHANPCGIASDPDLGAAYEAALASDPVSAYGGIVALNRPLDIVAAERIAASHFDIVIAPDFVEGALARLRRKKRLRLLAAPAPQVASEPEIRPLEGGFLLQEPDRLPVDPSAWQLVSRRAPRDAEMDALVFAWRAVRYVKSNAIVLAQGEATVGIGGGQPNRVDAVRIAVARAGERAAGSVMASDAYFPFPDNIEVAAAAGVRAVVAPGGSRRDPEVIAAADAANLTLLFTSARHFRH